MRGGVGPPHTHARRRYVLTSAVRLEAGSECHTCAPAHEVLRQAKHGLAQAGGRMPRPRRPVRCLHACAGAAGHE